MAPGFIAWSQKLEVCTRLHEDGRPLNANSFWAINPTFSSTETAALKIVLWDSVELKWEKVSFIVEKKAGDAFEDVKTNVEKVSSKSLAVSSEFSLYEGDYRVRAKSESGEEILMAYFSVLPISQENSPHFFVGSKLFYGTKAEYDEATIELPPSGEIEVFFKLNSKVNFGCDYILADLWEANKETGKLEEFISTKKVIVDSKSRMVEFTQDFIAAGDYVFMIYTENEVFVTKEIFSIR